MKAKGKRVAKKVLSFKGKFVGSTRGPIRPAPTTEETSKVRVLRQVARQSQLDTARTSVQDSTRELLSLIADFKKKSDEIAETWKEQRALSENGISPSDFVKYQPAVQKLMAKRAALREEQNAIADQMNRETSASSAEVDAILVAHHGEGGKS